MRLLLLLLLMPLVSGYEFTEVHYDPEGDDNNREFVEVLGNMSGCLAGDSSGNDSLELLQTGNGNLGIITEEGYNESIGNASWYSAGKTIGDNLNNGGDSLFLYCNQTLVANMSYDGFLAHGNNLSLQWLNGTWTEAEPTPGIFIRQTENFTFNSTNSTQNTTNSTLNQTNTSTNNTPCTLSIQTDGQWYHAGDKIRMDFVPLPEPETFSITYWVEDSVEAIVKKPHTTTNLDPKSFTPKIEEQDAIFFIQANLSSPLCNESITVNRSVFFIDPGYAPPEPPVCPACKKQSCSCPERSAEEKPTGSIVNVYVKQKNYKNATNLYVRISARGTVNLTVQIANTTISELVEINRTNTIKIPLVFSQDAQPATISIRKEGTLLDMATFYLIPEEKETPACPKSNTAETLPKPPLTTGYTIPPPTITTEKEGVTKYIKWVVVFLTIGGAAFAARAFHERKRDNKQDRPRMDPGKDHLRDRGQPERPRRPSHKHVHLGTEEEQGHRGPPGRGGRARGKGQDLEHVCRA